MTPAAQTDELLGTPWPFGRADLTAGLRRHLGDATIQVTEVRPLTMTHRRPSVGRIQGLRVEFQSQRGPQSIRLVVKEPLGTTRMGLAGVGRREVGVYQSLAGQLPVSTPALIAAGPLGGWLLLEAITPGRDASRWEAVDYDTAIDSLVRLHDRFWDLGEDLATFPWLSRPLEADFEVHVTAAAQAIERIVQFGEPAVLAASPDRLRVLALLTESADRIVRPLRAQAATLLHGDYWPGNIAVLRNRSQVVYDWQLAAVGPGIIDLLVFISKSQWWFGDLPVPAEELIGRYRERVATDIGVTWEQEAWDLLWDHALMWRFLQEWVDLLAATPDAVLQTRGDQLDRVWLDPVAVAVARRLGAE